MSSMPAAYKWSRVCPSSRAIRTLGVEVHLFSAASIGCRIGAQNQQLALANDLPGDIDRFSNHVEHLLIHGSSLLRDQQEVERRALFLAYQENRRNAPANAAHGTRPMRCESARIHHTQVALAIDDLTHQGLLAKADVTGLGHRL